MFQSDITLRNGTVITLDGQRRILPGHSVIITGPDITAVLPVCEGDSSYESKTIIDATGKFIFPGLINTHNHLFQVLLKGLARDKRLVDWAECLIAPSYRYIDNDNIYLAAMAGLIEQIHTGVTTSLDYQYAHGTDGLTDSVAKAYCDVGMRGIIARGRYDSSNLTGSRACDVNETEHGFFEAVRYLHESYKDNPLIDIGIAPGIVWCMSEDAFVTCAKLAKELDILVSIHMLESEEDNAYSIANYGLSTVDFYERCGILDTKLLGVHLALVTPEDITKLKAYDVTVSYNAISNMLMGYKTLPVVDLLDAGLTVSLGIDGAGSNDNQNMLEAMKISALWQKAFYRDPSVMPVSKILEMATIDGAKALYKDKLIGSIEPGKRADMFIFNPKTTNAAPVAEPVSALVYCSDKTNIETSVINGRIVMKDGVITGVDELDIINRLEAAAYKLRQSAGMSGTVWGQGTEARGQGSGGQGTEVREQGTGDRGQGIEKEKVKDKE